MIIRILGEGQRDLPEAELQALNELDDKLQAAVEGNDESAFRTALEALLGRVRNSGTQLPDEEIVPSDLVLPSSDASLEEVRALLSDDGLIPG